MIVYTHEKEIEIGKIYHNNTIWDVNKEPQFNQPILILREATKEEYIEQCVILQCDHLIKPGSLDKSDVKFYEVLTD